MVQPIFNGVPLRPKSLEQKVVKNLFTRKNNLLSQVVRGRIHSFPDFQEACEALQVNIRYHTFACISFEVEDASNLFFEEHTEFSEDMWDSIMYIINNVGEELAGEKYSCLIGETSGMILCLLNIPDDISSDDAIADMERIAQMVYELMLKDFGVTLSCNISDLHVDTSGIITCYEELQEIIESRSWMIDEKPLIVYRNIREPSVALSRMEKDAIASIRAHSYKEAIVLLQTLESEAMALKATEGSSPASVALVNSINAYILENYRNPNLSAGTIASKFGISPSSLSQLYKKNTSSGVLDEIHHLRIQAAKRLLLDGHTVQNTANLVGYCNTRTMIRAFKRLENMTPTEYKEMYYRSMYNNSKNQ